MEKPFLIPREGPENPLFSGLRKRDGVEVLIGFEKPLSAPSAKKLKSIIHGWIGRTDWRRAGGRARFAPIELDGAGARLVFTSVPRPREALDDFVRAITKHFPLRDVSIARRPLDRKGAPGPALEDPRMPPQRGYRTEAAWWRASFDPKAAQPSVEDDRGLFSVAQTEDGQMIPETRPASLCFPGVRISYGLGDVRYPKPDTRAREVSRVIRKCLERSFSGKRPAVYNHKGERDGVVDKLSRGGRVGYAFAVLRDGEMVASYPGCFRYREHELMAGLVDAIEKLDLEPVIHWDRAHVYILNLWERMGRSMRPGPKKARRRG